MLERQNRLRGQQLFQELFAHGKRAFASGITGFSLPLKDDRLVIGVTFKQKAFPKAVTRHRYKRQTLAWMRTHLDRFPRGRAFVIHFNQPLPHHSPQTLTHSLDQLTQILIKL